MEFDLLDVRWLLNGGKYEVRVGIYVCIYATLETKRSYGIYHVMNYGIYHAMEFDLWMYDGC